MELSFWTPTWEVLVGMLLMEMIVGDRGGALHPVVLMGKSLRWFELKLEGAGLWNRRGGVLLSCVLIAFWSTAGWMIFSVLNSKSDILGFLFLSILGGWLIACKSLIEHTQVVSPGRDGDLEGMREAVGWIVGRDTSSMDEEGCRRASVESLAESLVDGILTPIFFYVIGGIGAVVIFKVISTMDSMVGYKNDRYLYFGWAGARLDDVCNWIPARLSWVLISMVAWMDPRFYGGKALSVGWRFQHHLPGFNSGWPEATLAGAMDRRLVGPIYRDGHLETELWIGDAESPPCGSPKDLSRARHLILEVSVAGCFVALLFLI